MLPKFRLVHCPQCRELLTEFADIPLYRCGRCDAILQAKNFRSVVVNERAYSSSTATEDGPCTLTYTNDSDDDSLPQNDRSAIYQSERDASDLELLSVKVGTMTAINVPPVIGGEHKCTVTKNTSEQQGNMNENASSSNLEISESTDGKGEALKIDGHNMKQDVVDGNPVSITNDEKTGAVSCHGGSESSSDSSGCKYEKGEIIFMDSIAAYPYKSFDGRNFVAGKSFGRKMPSTSEESSSVQDWLESESVTSFGGLSRTSNAGISEVDRRKILRKIDELRNQLIRTRIRSRGLDVGDHARGAGRAGSHHRFDSFDSSHSRQSSLSISQHSFSMVETSNNVGHIQSTSMLLRPTQSHCLSRDHDQASGQSEHGPFSSGIYRNSCHICSKHLKSDGFQYFAPSNPVRYYHNAQRHELHSHDMQNRNSKMEQLDVKRHCRPILGGSSFISCYKCLRVLEMPDDFQFFMRTHAKLQCGFCFEVLKFSVYKKTKIVPYCFAFEQIPHTELEDYSNATLPVRGTPPNHYNSQSWGVPYFNEYDLSASSFYSMEGEDKPYRGTCEIQVPLHSLMGYISASEVLYQDQE